MSAILTVCVMVWVVLVMVGAVGLYRLSGWLERWDYERHFND